MIKIICRRIAYLALYLVDVLAKRTNRTVVLCYHSISSDSWRFGVALEDLKKHIEHLETRYEFVTAHEMVLRMQGKKTSVKPAVLLTFDDGYSDVMKTREFFREKGIKPVLFVLSDDTNANRYELKTTRKFLSRAEILSLYQDGWTIGCHSATHANFAKLTEAAMQREIIDAKQVLEKRLGIPIVYFAYPKGTYTKAIIESVKRAGYTAAFSMDSKVSLSTIYAVPRVGVDRTHSLREFKTLFSPTVMAVKDFLMQNIPGVAV